MKKAAFLLVFSIFSLIFLLVAPVVSQADELDDINKKLSELTTALSQSKAATAPLESQLNSMQKQIKDIKASVLNIEADIAIKKKNIDKGYEDLEKQQEILNRAISNYYMNSYQNSPLLAILSAKDASEITQVLALQRASADKDKAIITNIALSISDLETKKQNLESEQVRLVAIKATLDKQSAELDKVVSGARAYQTTLSSQISQLSAKQQSLLAAKLGSLNIPLYAYNTQGGCSSDIEPYKDPGFGGTKIAMFTYGVPNRVGLNQYGAWGRAKAGQNADTILRAYYNFDAYQNMDATIRVNDSNGYDSGNIIWSGSLEDYMKRIWEVPDSWTDNDLAALKAQAIAARSYVMYQTNNGNKSICSTTYCQVFQTNPKGGNWETAVNATANQVMVQGGQAIGAYFSSTHGGYIYSSGGDISSRPWTKDGKDTSTNIASFADLKNNAYDKDSPWFYCDWGSRSAYNKTAWLKAEEMADIVNSILLVQSDNSADPHILQTDKGYSDAWNEDKVRQELSKYRTPFGNISSGRVDVDFGSGRTTRVYFSGDNGSVDFDSTVFKKYFNLRAPSNINIVGPLYNVETR